jgi:ATP/maltotriose-dependent transcriptional regulator MalT
VRDEAQSVLADAREAGARDIEGRALVLLAEMALRADSDVPAARELADEALAALPADDIQGLYDARTLLSRIAWWIGDADGCRHQVNETLALARQLGRLDLESLALAQLSGIASVEDDVAEARELSSRALALAEESGSREALGMAKTMAGRDCLRQDDLDGAEASLREGLAAYEEIGAAGRAGWVMTSLGALALKRGDVGRAEEILRDAVRRLGNTQEQGYLVEAQRVLAEALVQAGKVGEAERIAEHARRAVGRDDVWSRASTLHALGLVKAAQGCREDACTLLREALAIVEPTMYKLFADEVRTSLDLVQRGATAAA